MGLRLGVGRWRFVERADQSEMGPMGLMRLMGHWRDGYNRQLKTANRQAPTYRRGLYRELGGEISHPRKGRRGLAEQ